MPTLLIAGCGFVGEALADLATANGWQVFGWTATAESTAAQGDKPYRVTTCDITSVASVEAAAAALPEIDAVVDCVSSGRGRTAEAYREIYLEGARNLIACIPCRRFLFTSSTSVYGQSDGSVVTETSPAEPDRDTGKVLRETEDLVIGHGGTVVRLSGLYGPGRSVILKKFLSGTAVIEGDGERFINQIHRDDAASAIFHLLAADVSAGIYNACDDQPIRQRDIYAVLARHFGRPLPPTGPRDLNRKRGWTHKQVSNAKLKASGAGWAPRYTSFEEALLRDDRL